MSNAIKNESFRNIAANAAYSPINDLRGDTTRIIETIITNQWALFALTAIGNVIQYEAAVIAFYASCLYCIQTFNLLNSKTSNNTAASSYCNLSNIALSAINTPRTKMAKLHYWVA